MLAIALFQGGATSEAEVAARRAVELKSNSPDAANILAAILGRTGRYAEAVGVLAPLGERLRKFPGMCLNLGLAYRGMHDHAAAARWLHHAIEGDPRLPGAHENLGAVLSELGQNAAAAAAFHSALALDENNANARHMLSALEGITPDSPPAHYVRALFDDYAPRFERELVGQLDYRVPETLRRLTGECGSRRFGRALDLGCGTGLSGAAFRNDVDEIVGIDLAPAMIAEAKKKKLYNALFTMEIAAYLASNDAKRKPFDLVIAADVFIYVGKLDDIFATLAERMATGGLLAFSIEGCVDKDFALRASGRYAHDVCYIENLARRNGFDVRACKSVPIRKASDGTVDGFAVVLERGS